MDNREGTHRYCRNFDFTYMMTMNGRREQVEVTMTSVLGHMTELEFDPEYRKWSDCDPAQLFTAGVSVYLTEDGKKISRNLQKEARGAQQLMIWTDCDREGEHIGSEVAAECRKGNPRIVIKRARFSAIIANQIHSAFSNAGELDLRMVAAVEARTELDLRLGAAFTRLQTLNLRRLQELADKLISYGPCQFPTLGFVTDQHEKVVNFISEPFWHIVVTVQRPLEKGANVKVDFRWKRGHVFDHATAVVLFEMCIDEPEAKVFAVERKSTRKFKPYPLTTVELQKSGSRLLRLSPKRVLDVAEKLYQRGLLSYPRTETDQFDKAFDFRTLLQKQTSDSDWGQYAQGLVDSYEGGGTYSRPRNGQKNDQAHPPIHPTAHANDLSGDEKRVYEYVTRRFLGSCSKDAVGFSTSVEIDIAEERFTTSGLIIQERNYLDVFVYDKWKGSLLPNFEVGETFMPTACNLREGKTSRPKMLTEADLVSLMDKNGIGTDATIAEHIAKIIDREYVFKVKQGTTEYLYPSTLGMGLVTGYNQIGHDKSLSKPLLRRETEYRMSLICSGQRTRRQTVEESLDEYREMFGRTRQQFNTLAENVAQYLRNPPELAMDDAEDGRDDDGGARGGGGDEDEAQRGPGAVRDLEQGAPRQRGNDLPRPTVCEPHPPDEQLPEEHAGPELVPQVLPRHRPAEVRLGATHATTAGRLGTGLLHVPAAPEMAVF
ncbi:DNA topoisomerase [Tilletia horrida]|nr:DNA topoisomerase [Tilletia horrida]